MIMRNVLRPYCLRKLVLPIFLVSALAMITGYASNSQAKDKEFTVGAFLQPSPIQYGLGLDRYKDNINFTIIDSSAAAFPLMINGTLAGLTNVSLLPTAIGISKKLKLKIIWMDIVEPDVFVVSPDIKTAQDLKGKKIGTVTGSLTDYMLAKYLTINNLTESDIVKVNLESQSTATAFETKQIDGAFIWPPFWNQMVASGGHILAESGKGGIPKGFQLYIFSDRFIKDNRKELQEFVCTTALAQKDMLNEYPKALSVMAKRVGISEEGVKAALPKDSIIPPKDVVTSEWLGDLPNNIYDAAKWGEGLGIISHAPTVNEIGSYIDPSFAQYVADGKCSGMGG